MAALLLAAVLLAAGAATGHAQQSGAEAIRLVSASSNNFPPINVLDADGDLTGFGRELADAVAEAAGVTVTHIHSGVWTEVLDWLDSGEADFIHDSGYTEERTSYLDYTAPILEMPERIFVLADRSDIDSFADLAGKKVACVNQHITHLYLKQFPEIDCLIVKRPVEGLYALVEGEADAFIYPKQIALYLAHNIRLRNRVKMVGEPLRTLTWHMVVKKGNAPLVELLNRGIAKVRASGQYDRIYARWFGEPLLAGYTQREVTLFVGAAIGLSLLAAGVVFAVLFAGRMRSARDRLAQAAVERVEAYGALRESEERFRATFERAAVGIVHTSRDGRFLRVNQKLCEITGYTRGELLERSFADITHPDDREAGVDAVRRLLAGDIDTYSAEKRYLRRNGTIAWVSLTVALLRPDSGESEYFISVIVDITERRQAEAMLQQFATAIESTSEALALYDADDRLIFFNRAWRDFNCEVADSIALGMTFEELMRVLIAGGLAPAAAGREEAWLRERLEWHRNPGDPIEIARQGGIWLLTNEQRLPDGGTITISLDITERKRAEEALRLSEMRLSGILDISAEAIISVDQDQTIVMFNQGAQHIFGYDAEEAIGKPLGMLLPQRVRANHRSHVEGFDESRETTRLMMTERGEVAGLRKDGTEFPAEASISKLDLDGQRIFTVTLRDDSERKRAEEQLRQAQKMEAIGQLTGGIAHDFNNLLGVILGNAELLSDRLGEDDRQIWALLRAATRGAELTQRMLAFSRQQPLQPKAIDVGALADGMVDLLRRSLGETIEIKIAAGKDLWTATADPGLVESALLNLALNARDAMPGGGTLIIETGNVALDETYAATRDDVVAGDYVLLSVTDTGTGMTPEVLSHVFEPFFTTKEIGEGSGLGLSMVYGFAKQSGGHIAIYSESGEGTTVNLYLPRTGAEAESSEMASEAEAPRGRGETVLVVEDDEDIRAIVSGMLEGLGYRVREAPDAAAGLALLKETPDFDLLLTDMVLPGGKSGRDLAAEAARRFGVLKVLFMSGYSSEAIHLNGWMEQGAELLRKPFRRHELATKVRAVLDRLPG